MEWAACQTLDSYVARTLPKCDALVALSGSGLAAGRRAQAEGAIYVCDRASTHIRSQNQLLHDEYKYWNLSWAGIDPRVIDKEEAEYDKADYITVPSEFNFQSFLSQGVSPHKLRKISYGANIKRFSPSGNRVRNRFIVLYVGQLSLRKGFPYLFEAFNRLSHPAKELWLVGSIAAESKSLFDRLLPKQARFLGRVPNTQLSNIYSQAHAFVLPSIEEGLAYVQGEALACGCPVIASKNTGGQDLFEDGKEGFFVPIRDAQAITDRLTQLADDPLLWQAMSEAAVIRTREMGGWDTYGETYYQFLKNVTAGRETQVN